MEVFDSFYKDLQVEVPNLDDNVDSIVQHIESTYYPKLLKILQRDETLFDEPLLFRTIDVSKIWKEDESKREMIWKHLLVCVLTSFFHGDFKEKIGTLIGTVKGLWNSSGQENDEINKILNDEKSEDYFKEIIDYLQDTRLAKIFTEIVEQIDISELELNFENPQDVIDIIRNPEHPKIKKLITKIQALIQQKMQRGEFTQQQLMSEVEGIKLKIQSLFGNALNNMLGIPTNRNREPRPILNTPQARAQYKREQLRQRLQRKYDEAERKKNNSQ